jgi:hypothetical protein
MSTFWSDDNPLSACRSVILFCLTVVCFIWTTGNGGRGTPGLTIAPSPDSASPNAGGGLTPSSGIVLGPRIVETFLFVLGIVYFVLVIRTFWIWSSVGAIPLRVGEGEHVGDHYLKEDHVPASAPAAPARGLPGGPVKELGVVPEMKEGGSSHLAYSPDQHTDADEKRRGRSPGRKDTTRVEVVVSKGETGWEKGRGRWWSSSKDNLEERAGKMADVDILDLPVEAEFEPRRTTDGSSERDVPRHDGGTSSTPGSVLGVSLHG